MRQHCTDGSFRFCRWRTHTEALSEDSGPEALSTQGQYFALHVFYEILQHIAGELSVNCCRTLTMTRYTDWCTLPPENGAGAPSAYGEGGVTEVFDVAAPRSARGVGKA